MITNTKLSLELRQQLIQVFYPQNTDKISSSLTEKDKSKLDLFSTITKIDDSESLELLSKTLQSNVQHIIELLKKSIRVEIEGKTIIVTSKNVTDIIQVLFSKKRYDDIAGIIQSNQCEISDEFKFFLGKKLVVEPVAEQLGFSLDILSKIITDLAMRGLLIAAYGDPSWVNYLNYGEGFSGFSGFSHEYIKNLLPNLESLLNPSYYYYPFTISLLMNLRMSEAILENNEKGYNFPELNDKYKSYKWDAVQLREIAISMLKNYSTSNSNLAMKIQYILTSQNIKATGFNIIPDDKIDSIIKNL
jgi:hypothetical protein